MNLQAIRNKKHADIHAIMHSNDAYKHSIEAQDISNLQYQINATCNESLTYVDAMRHLEWAHKTTDQ